jgi:Flp pilus assembly protein TadD
VALDQGDCSTALRLFEESLTIQREIGQSNQSAYTLHNLGLVAFRQGDYTAAHRFLRESATIDSARPT